MFSMVITSTKEQRRMADRVREVAGRCFPRRPDQEWRRNPIPLMTDWTKCVHE